MKNEEIEFNFQDSKNQKVDNKDNIFLSKKHLITNEFIFEDFDNSLNISGIVNNEENQKNRKYSKNSNTVGKDFSEDLDNFNDLESESTIRKISVESIQIDLNNNSDKKQIKKKLTKEDLNNIPLPVFDCIYCTNEKIVFRAFVNNILSNKYLFLTSKYDIDDLTKLIQQQPLIDKNDKKEKLLNIIIKNTEYIKEFYPKEKNFFYFKSQVFNNLCDKFNSENQRSFKQKIEDTLVRKKKDFYFRGINKIPKNSMNNKCLFNSTNSLINNCNTLCGLVESVQQNLANNNIKNIYTSCSNNSINFNSLSLNNNEFVYNSNCKENNLDYIVENIEKKEESLNDVDDKDEIIDFFKFDLVRKISKNDVKWDNKYYNIWNPDISSDSDSDLDENIDIDKKENKNYTNNKNNAVSKSLGSNLFYYYNTEKNNSIQNIFEFNKNFSLEKSVKIPFKDEELKKYIKNYNKNPKNVNPNKSQRINNFLNISNNTKIFSANPKFGKSYLKSFCSTSTNNNSSNINKSSIHLNKSKPKNFNNKNKKKTFLQYNSCQQNDNSSTNYSIGVSILSNMNNSTKSNNILLTQRNYFSDRSTYFQNKNNIYYNKQRICKKSSNKKLIKYINSNLEKDNNKYRSKNNFKRNDNKRILKNNYKSQNKKINYNNYIIHPNILYTKENYKGIACNTSNNNFNRNNFTKSNIILTSNSFFINNNNLYNKTYGNNIINNSGLMIKSKSKINFNNENYLHRTNNKNSNTRKSNKNKELKKLNKKKYNNELYFSANNREGNNNLKDFYIFKNVNDFKNNKSTNYINFDSNSHRRRYNKSLKKYFKK